MTKSKEFIDRKKEFENAAKYNVNMKLDYLIAQVHTLYNIIAENINNDSAESDFITGTVIERILDKNIDTEKSLNLDYLDDITASDIVKEELENWGLKESYVGCKYIMAVVNMGENHELNSDTPYDEIAKYFEPDFKRNITFIRKKANFKNSKYLTILSKLPTEQITNELLLKNILELCEED